MKVLAWDTSTKSGTLIALECQVGPEAKFSDAKLLAEMTFNVDSSSHSEGLLWGIHHCLVAAKWRIEDVDTLGVGVGPGSFTGLRIGLTTARTLGQTLKKPVVGVSSLAALVRPVAKFFSATGKLDPMVLGATDACKGEVFLTYGKASEFVSSDFENLVQEKVIAPADGVSEVVEKLESYPKNSHNWVAVGEGFQRYSEVWAKLPKSKRVSFGGIFSDLIQGRYLGELIWEAIQSGHQQDALQIQPKYLRASDAEVKLKKGLLRTN